MKLKLTADEPLFCIALWDYALPSFCSGSTLYLGTQTMLDQFFDALEQALRERNEGELEHPCYEGDILEAYRKYQAGDKRVKACIAYADIQLICPAALHHLSPPRTVAPFDNTHINIWGCPYVIKAAAVRYQTAYVECRSKFCRVVLAECDGVRYRGEGGARDHPMSCGTWGHPAMLAVEERLLYGRLMFLERQFKSRTEMQADIAAPAGIDFSGFFNDYFGDG